MACPDDPGLGCGWEGTAVDAYALLSGLPPVRAARAAAAAAGIDPPSAASVHAAAPLRVLRDRWGEQAGRLADYNVTASALHAEIGCHGHGRRDGGWGTATTRDLKPLTGAWQDASPAARRRLKEMVGVLNAPAKNDKARESPVAHRVAVVVPAWDGPGRIAGGWVVGTGRRSVYGGYSPAVGFGIPAGGREVVVSYDAAACVGAAAPTDTRVSPAEAAPAFPVAGRPEDVAEALRVWGVRVSAVWGGPDPWSVRLAKALGVGVVPRDSAPDPAAAAPWTAAAAGTAARLPAAARADYLLRVGWLDGKDAVLAALPPDVAASVLRSTPTPRGRVVRSGRLRLAETETGWVDARTGRQVVPCRPAVTRIVEQGGLAYYLVEVRARVLSGPVTTVPFRDATLVPSAKFRDDPWGMIEDLLVSRGVVPPPPPRCRRQTLIDVAFADFPKGA